MKHTNEVGRSLLEMLAIIALIVLLSFGGIMLYGMVITQNEAAVLHQDIMVRGRLNKEGIPKTKKMFDTRMEGKSRLKNREIVYEEKADGYYYSYTVNNINEELCKLLATKYYDDADRVVINGITYALVNVETENGGSIHKIIEDTPECLETNAFEVVFKKSSGTGSYIPKICKTDNDCPPTRHCEDGVCKDTCDECKPNEICFHGKCVPVGDCTKGNCCPQNCCECDSATDVCTKCKEGYYLSEGECLSCPANAICTGCKSRPTFDCPDNFEKDPVTPACNCPAGYKLDEINHTCTPCPIGTYSSAANSTECTNCPCGTYNNAKGQSSCSACPNGHYAKGTKNTTCTATTGRQYVLPSNRCEAKTASICNKPNENRTGEIPCETTETTCDAPQHKYPDGKGKCVCYTKETQGDCPDGKLADGNCHCVTCVNDKQCSETQCNTNDGECCPSDKPYYDSKNKKCIACNGNYGSGATLECGETIPVCSNDVCTTCGNNIEFNTNTHTCCPTDKPYYDSKNKKCIACNGNYGSGATRECEEATPVCSDDICTTCASGIEFNTHKHQCCTTGKPHYDSNVQKCVECVQSEHCPLGKVCNTDNVCEECPLPTITKITIASSPNKHADQNIFSFTPPKGCKYTMTLTAQSASCMWWWYNGQFVADDAMYLERGYENRSGYEKLYSLNNGYCDEVPGTPCNSHTASGTKINFDANGKKIRLRLWDCCSNGGNCFGYCGNVTVEHRE